MIEVGLFVAALCLAVVEEVRTQGRSIIGYAVGFIAVGLLIGSGVL